MQNDKAHPSTGKIGIAFVLRAALISVCIAVIGYVLLDVGFVGALAIYVIAGSVLIGGRIVLAWKAYAKQTPPEQ